MSNRAYLAKPTQASPLHQSCANPEHLPEVLPTPDDAGATGHLLYRMVGAGYLVELLFGVARLIPAQRSAKVMTEGIAWNYTTWLNIAFLILAAVPALDSCAPAGSPCWP